MNVIIKRRQLILATLVVALGAAVFVNWYYTGSGNVAQKPETTAEYVQNLGEAKYVNAEAEQTDEDYFETAKLNRTKTNDEALDKLNKALEKAGQGTEEAKTIAANVNQLTDRIKTEKDLENIIETKLKTKCVVIINESSSEIMVEKGVLDETSALKIMELVTSNTDLDATKVTISEIK